jgi:hypothetical protein
MKVSMIAFFMLMSFFANSRELEFIEYFSIYSDYEVPSINLGMYHLERTHRDVKTDLLLANKTLEKWKTKKYFGVMDNKLVKLKIKGTDIRCYGSEESIRKDLNCNLRILFEKLKGKIKYVLTRNEKFGVTSLQDKDVIDRDFSFFDLNTSKEREKTSYALGISVVAGNWPSRYDYSQYRFGKNKGLGYSLEVKRNYYKKSEKLNKQKIKKRGNKKDIKSTVNVVQVKGHYQLFDYKYIVSGLKGRCFSRGRVIEVCFDDEFVNIKLDSIIMLNQSEYYVFNYKNHLKVNDNEVLLVRKTKNGVVEVKRPNGYIIAQTYRY